MAAKKSFGLNPKFSAFSNVYKVAILLFSLGMLITTPQSAGPDEPMNQATSWYAIHNGITPKVPSTVIEGVPSKLIIGPCFAFKPNTTSDCLKTNSSPLSMQDFPVFNYPPVYFWIMGIGQSVFSIFGDQYGYLGARILGLLSILSVILFSIKKLELSGIKYASEALFIALTPMCYFIFTVANPTGWEVATSILFFSILTFESKKLSNRPLMFNSKLSRKSMKFNIPILLSGLLLVFSRPLSFFWLLLIFGLVLVNLHSKNRIRLGNYSEILKSILVTQIAGLMWLLTHPENSKLAEREITTNVNIFELLGRNAIHSLLSLHEKYKQTWGVLGWLDTRPPNIVFGIMSLGGAYFLLQAVKKNPQNKFAIAYVGITLNFTIILIESYKWDVWPNWWQGRYSLPVISCLVVSLLINNDQITKIKRLAALKALIVFGNILMVLLNLYRYKIGLWNELDYTTFVTQAGIVNCIFIIAFIFVSLYLLRMISFENKAHDR